ncbi:hypothetical protein NE237_021034 [Protea cynaroides]|uniref:Uncharacterized protein n=1 Tax=Protea cynaroides TaxID=273540 RepID=A0A9Q0H8D7_9MAGN|nr:hypothetical protein NE237_021034 [Protea cynaroides]
MRPSFDNNVSTILATNAADDLEVDVNRLLKVIRKILESPTSSVEISCKCSGGGDPHSITKALLKRLSSYSSAATVVLVLASLAVTYADYLLVVNSNSVNPLANRIREWQQSAAITENFEKLKKLISTTVKVAILVVKFDHLLTKYTSLDQVPTSETTKQIDFAVHWTIRSVHVASRIIDLYQRCEIPNNETYDDHLKRITDIHDKLQKQVDPCHAHIAYHQLVRLFKKTSNNIDNIEILKALIYNEDDPKLLDFSTNNKVDIEVVKDKRVLLLIFDLDTSKDELSILAKTFNIRRQHRNQYEVVLLPVMDSSLSPETWRETWRENGLQPEMEKPWYTLVDRMNSGVIKYIKDEWKFNKKPILRVLNQGKVINHNAFHMMCIWGNKAFPFTKGREIELWGEEEWNFDLIKNQEIDDSQVICLYGGETDWRNEFQKLESNGGENAEIKFESIYVGNRYTENEDAMNVHKSFWIRQESMWYSMMQNETIIEDNIKEGIKTMLSFNGSKKMWAVISWGSSQTTKVAKRETILDFIKEYESKNDEIKLDKFFSAFKELKTSATTRESHCSHLYLPGTVDSIQKTIPCAECGSIMEVVVMYRCCPKYTSSANQPSIKPPAHQPSIEPPANLPSIEPPANQLSIEPPADQLSTEPPANLHSIDS